MAKHKIETGTVPADAKFKVVIAERGPYLVYGRPPLAMQFIMLNEMNECWYFQEGKHFSTENNPTALCRCGMSGNKPYCDGTHKTKAWDSRLSDEGGGLLNNIELTEGETVTLSDNPRYCVYARFCDAAGGVRALTEASADPEARRLAIREASMCPSGRLMAWDNETEKPYEFRYEPSLGLIEDPAIASSGGLWIRGGIKIQREDGRAYETRNRNVLCRCGLSTNKPYCDGTHAAARWRDNIEGTPVGETVPEKVY